MKRRSTLQSCQNQGFTLVEMLIVIAIIGIMAGILIPTIGVVRKSAANGGMAMEVSNISAAIEAYKQKYGDYPPDGSNIVVFQRHIQVAFPRIAPAEVVNLINLIDLKDSNGDSTGRTIIDPAEALVFFLGGFSDDPRYPFTGEGGPLSRVRRNPLFDFRAGKLTQSTNMINIGTAANPVMVPLSTDEEQLFGTGASDSDIFPAYIPSSSDIPFVYFDHRTYTSLPLYSFNNNPVPPAQYPPIGRSFLQVGVHDGWVRAYRSDQARQSTAEDVFPFKWLGDGTFQIICAGVDNNLGTALPLFDANGNPQHKQFPSQKLFSDGDRSNIASFSAGVLEGGE
ncbi:MAG: prepilin-type N-terminal cleavage/methylation domain-containing protein [Pirellulaceae bacterium]|nr:prepilin-type N-terminal cleavage/methylation domain-containing protein [Pirellulaceae bacterium]